MSVHHSVSKKDLLQQLEVMKSRVIDPNAGIFGPGSMFWEIGKYSTAFVGAGRAALLQTAHPWVANGIKQHSRTMQDPLSRFRGTFTNVFTMVYGSVDKVMESAFRVHNVHTRIKGAIEEDSGAFSKGSHYQANHIDAMIWVHATLWETSVKMYELVIGPLTRDEKERYYQETKMFALLFGLPESSLPKNWPEFIEYNEAMWNSDQLTVKDAGKEIAHFLFTFNPLLKPVLSRYKIVTSMMMPERLREQYDLPPATAANLALYERYIGYLRKSYPYFPKPLRYLPPYVEARRRLKGLHEPDFITGSLNRLMLGQANLVS